MVTYKCDNCGKETTSKPEVWLHGVTGKSGGILLPEKHHDRNFCSPDCFWIWAEKFTPNDSHQPEQD
jgi:hypothetical protein